MAKSGADAEATLPSAAVIAAAHPNAHRLAWVDRLTSGWAPAAVFAVLFLVYLVIVELHTPAHRWGAPLLRSFGLLMLVWMFGTWGVRIVWRRFAELRRARHAGRELATEVASLLEKHGPDVAPKHTEELKTALGAVRSALGTNDLSLIQRANQSLSEAANHLARWRKGSGVDMVVGLAKALAIALLIRAVVLEPFKIPSGSMIPTLAIGDQIFVNKFIYGVRIPYANTVPFVIVREPKRGDVIVFENPFDPSKDFIKRVVAISGDKVELRGRTIVINDEVVPTEVVDPNYLYFDKLGNDWEPRRAQLVAEQLDGQPHLMLKDPLRPPPPSGGPWTVPDKHVFVLGDNRDNSQDSRYGLGRTRADASAFDGPYDVQFVPYGRIKGKAMVIWLSLSKGGVFSGLPIFEGTGLRTDRLFLPVR